MANGSDPQLGVKIVVSSEGDGKQAAEQIKEVAGAATEAKKATEEATDADKDATVSKQEFKAAVVALKREIPEVRAALDLLRSPYALLAAGVGTAVAALRNFNQELAAAEARAEKFANLSAEFGRFQQVAQSSRERAEDFAKAWSAMASEGKTALAILNQITAALQEQVRAQTELEDKTLSAQQRAAAARTRDRNARIEEAKAADAAARAEAERVGEARFALPEAVKASEAAEREALRQEFAAQETAAAVAEKLPKVRERRRELADDIRQIDERLEGQGGSVASRELLRRERAKQAEALKGAEADEESLINERINAAVEARRARRAADARVDEESGLRRTILESTEAGRGFNERARDTFQGVLRDAARDPDVRRSRPPQIPGVQSVEPVVGEIARAATGLNSLIDSLMRSFQTLNGVIERQNQKVERLGEQYRNNR